jgi:hypothetical protein
MKFLGSCRYTKSSVVSQFTHAEIAGAAELEYTEINEK